MTILHYPTGINPSTSPQWSIWILWDCDLNLSCASSPGINFLAFHTDSCIIVDLSFGIKPLGGKLKSNILPRPRTSAVRHLASIVLEILYFLHFPSSIPLCYVTTQLLSTHYKQEMILLPVNAPKQQAMSNIANNDIGLYQMHFEKIPFLLLLRGGAAYL